MPRTVRRRGFPIQVHAGVSDAPSRSSRSCTISLLQTVPQLLARRAIIGRNCLGPMLVVQKTSEADAFGQGLEWFCEVSAQVRCVVSRSVDPETPCVIVMLFFALPVRQELEDAAGR
jgi:hypothetical protein